ncbi:MAG: ATP synthase F1 subunit epsilon [Acidithiobacillus ferrooxidans]|nr:ATP synthase F1 subunit epsilon [Acidithiobacillus ferrooxidans]MBU2856645.1 ATP synthase F1 subunit epsilon [Acidithiobacillus ferrooxidans]MBU2860407.1 ATP synthase F1 subunit epsilon [Acidithiobacillus ferrooxidans]MCR2828794.1 ATP synthase F1 subunit epsilon [Acidithiobacillus ferrooxidans]MDA8152831.1 ATP synthase F1 subunit epsilon [Acidithiobacillus sp.]
MQQNRTFRLNVVDVHGEVYTGMARFVAVPAELGEIGILPGHAPLLSGLRPGELRITQPDGQTQILFLEGGMLEIQPDIVTILADASLRISDIDIHESRERIKDAQSTLAKRAVPAMDFARAELELQREVAKLHAYQRYQIHEQRGGGTGNYNWERPALQNVPKVNVQELED